MATISNNDMIKVYWKPNCKFCEMAKALLSKHNLDYQPVELGSDISIEYFKMVNPEVQTAPAIFVNERFIGGYTELKKSLEPVAAPN